MPLPSSHICFVTFHVENYFGSQPLVALSLRAEVNMAFVKKRRILPAVVRAGDAG